MEFTVFVDITCIRRLGKQPLENTYVQKRAKKLCEQVHVCCGSKKNGFN